MALSFFLPFFHHIDGPASGLSSLAYAAFTIWMFIDCVRKDPERQLWAWLIIVLPPIGPFIYFFVRWLPTNDLRTPPWLRNLTSRSEIGRLEGAAFRIGNPYHYVQLGDALREIQRDDQAAAAYERALEKEPGNLAALWGAALIDIRRRSFDSASERLEKILQLDPQYKFGDVSLCYAQSLLGLERVDDARAHLEKHAQRWRQPEGIYLLATLYARAGRFDECRLQLQTMLIEIECSPQAIARKQSRWRRRGYQLLRRIEKERPAISEGRR